MNIHAKTISGILLSGISCSNAIAEVVLDGSTGSSGDVNAINQRYEITSDLGRQEGGNLYHSFQNFNVETDHTANFSGPASVNNIISRVTGGEASHIDGTISSSITGANLYLLNPSGLLFGANASIDVSGAFHVSTADYLRMGEDDYFYTNLAQDSSFVAASPTAFGFTSNNVASITIEGTYLDNNGGAISLIGGDMSITDSDDGTYPAEIVSDDGLIQIASVASQGEVVASDSDLIVDDFSELGEININKGSRLDTSGASGGRVVIRGGTLIMDQASITSSAKKGEISNYSDNINIETASSISINHGSTIKSEVGLFGTADTKGIKIKSDDILLSNESSVESNVRILGTGNSGNIELKADSVTLSDSSTISAKTQGRGNSGGIYIITEENVTIGSGSTITSDVTATGSGNSGEISISAKNLRIIDHSYVKSRTGGQGSNGDIKLNANDIIFKNGGFVTSTSVTDADAGNIKINSDNILIKGPALSESPFFIDTTGIYILKSGLDSNGGNLLVNNNNELIMDNRSMIVSFSSGAYSGGNIKINSNEIHLLNGSRIGSNATGGGNGGNIEINANDIQLSGVHNQHRISETGNPIFDHSQIFSIGSINLNEEGDTGDLNITADKLTITDGALINSVSYFKNEVGNVNIKANDISVSGVNLQTKNRLLSFGISLDEALKSSSSNISTEILKNFPFIEPPANGSTNKFSIVADNITLHSNGYINTGTEGIAHSSDLYITAKSIDMKSGSYIASSAQSGRGNAGNIFIKASKIKLDGTDSDVNKTGIYSSTNQEGGHSGSINISSKKLNLFNNAVITSESSSISSENAGDIVINSENYIELNKSSISAKAFEHTTSNAGNIDIKTNLLVLTKGEISTTATSGNGGDINIEANNFAITDDSIIDATSETSINGIITINSKHYIANSIIPFKTDFDDLKFKLYEDCAFKNDDSSKFTTTEAFNSITFSTVLSSNSGYSKLLDNRKADIHSGSNYELIQQKDFNHKNSYYMIESSSRCLLAFY